MQTGRVAGARHRRVRDQGDFKGSQPDEIKSLPRSVRKEIDIFCYYTAQAVFIPSIGLNAMNMAVYMNHSKTPNVQYRPNGQLFTLRAIKAGEEVMMDYDVNFGETHTFD